MWTLWLALAWGLPPEVEAEHARLPALMEAGDLRGAHALMGGLVEQWGSHEDASLEERFSLWHDHGIVALQLGAFDQAQQAHHHALELAEEAWGPESPQVAGELNNLGYVHFSTGFPARSVPLLERALAILRQQAGPEDPETANTENSLAAVLMELGDADRARPLYEHALEVFEATHGQAHPLVSQTQLNLAILLEGQGELLEAIALAEASLESLEAVVGPGHPALGHGRVQVGIQRARLGLIGEARTLLEAGVEELSRLPPEHPVRLHAELALGGLYAQLGMSARALRQLEPALRRWTEAGLGPDQTWMTAWTNVAQAAERLGDGARAAQAREEALAAARTLLGPDSDTVRILELRALRHAEVPSQARAQLGPDEGGLEVRGERLLTEITLFGRSEADLDALLAELVAERPGSHLHVAVFLAMLEQHVDDGAALLAAWQRDPELVAHAEAAAAWGATEEELVELRGLGRRQTRLLVGALSPDTSPALRDAVHRAVATTKARAQQVARARRAAGVDPELQRLRQLVARRALHPEEGEALEALEARLAELESQARGRRPTLAADPASACAALPRRGALVDLYVDQAGELVALVRAAGACEHLEVVPLAVASEVADAVEGLRAAVEARAEEPAQQRRQRLSALLWQPLAPVVGSARTLLISPWGAEAQAPWVALLDENAQPLVARRDLGLVEHLGEITTATTMPRRDWRLVAASGGALQRSDCAEALPALPGAAAEVTTVAAAHARWGGSGQVLTQPTETELESALPGAELVHLATHGVQLAPGCVRRDGLAWRAMAGAALALAPEGEREGLWTGVEVAALDLSAAELVVLSACGTGLGRAQAGEGVLGLRRAFAIAGARRAVASMWSVPDGPTAALMAGMYGALRRRARSPLRALSAAQRAAWRDDPEAPLVFAAWPAFVHLGSP